MNDFTSRTRNPAPFAEGVYFYCPEPECSITDGCQRVSAWSDKAARRELSSPSMLAAAGAVDVAEVDKQRDAVAAALPQALPVRV